MDRRMFPILGLIALVPDLDYFSLIYHRALFHNVFFGSFLVGLAYLGTKRWFGRQILPAGAFVFLVHLLMDFDPVGVGLLFPLSMRAYGLENWGLISHSIAEIQFGHISLSVLPPLEFLAIGLAELGLIGWAFQKEIQRQMG